MKVPIHIPPIRKPKHIIKLWGRRRSFPNGGTDEPAGTGRTGNFNIKQELYSYDKNIVDSRKNPSQASHGLNGNVFIHIGESPPSNMKHLTFSPCWEVGTRRRLYTPCVSAIEPMGWCENRKTFIYKTSNN